MFLTILTFLSAISISVIAAGYSILGLATLFAGAFIPIVAMGSALEVGKLVAASWLYHNWRSDIPRTLKAYLFTAIIVLIFITSLGIFGFLSKAHLDQVKPVSGNNIKIELLDKFHFLDITGLRFTCLLSRNNCSIRRHGFDWNFLSLFNYKIFTY